MRVVLALALALTPVGCSSSRPGGWEPSGMKGASAAIARPAPRGSGVTVAPREAPVERTPAASACQAEIAALENAPSPAPSPLERRAEIFARAKADPVLFVHAPAVTVSSGEGVRLRTTIAGAEDSVKALYDAYGTLQKRRDLAREVLLTDGYLYSERPALAAALTNLVRIEDLFQEPELWLQRGDAVLRLELRPVLHGKAYFHADGPSSGERARLLLFDRVATSPERLGTPLHREIGKLSKALGFSEMRVRKIAENAVLSDLFYEGDWVPTVLRAEGATLNLSCEAIPEGREASVARARERAGRRERVLARLRAVMEQQTKEALPFDEPKTEIGQEDGKLRQNWVWAYRYGRTQFDYNEDRYKVFDSVGRPRVPQVCIDFITDTFERASGSWYRGRGEPRERVAGRLDFAALGIDNERSVERFVEFARAHPDWFEVEEVPPEERVPYARRAEFFEHLRAHRDRYRPGDIVTIYGLRDDGKMHYHSFFVYESDPLTGVPSLVAANAGRPRIRPWESEMTSAPLRSIHARIRPRLEWLESVVVGAGEVG